jgi:hypothetical protein
MEKRKQTIFKKRWFDITSSTTAPALLSPMKHRKLLISTLWYYTTVVDIAVAFKIANISVYFSQKIFKKLFSGSGEKIFAGNIRTSISLCCLYWYRIACNGATAGLGYLEVNRDCPC